MFKEPSASGKSMSTTTEHISAMQRTTVITEIFEHIIFQLPMCDVARAQQVCSRWNDVIRDSPILQSRLFLKPSVNYMITPHLSKEYTYSSYPSGGYTCDTGPVVAMQQIGDSSREPKVFLNPLLVYEVNGWGVGDMYWESTCPIPDYYKKLNDMLVCYPSAESLAFRLRYDDAHRLRLAREETVYARNTNGVRVEDVVDLMAREIGWRGNREDYGTARLLLAWTVYEQDREWVSST